MFILYTLFCFVVPLGPGGHPIFPPPGHQGKSLLSN